MLRSSAFVALLVAVTVMAAVSCPPAAATTACRAPLGSAFKEWRADQASTGSVSSSTRAAGIVPAPAGSGALGASSEARTDSSSVGSRLTTTLPTSYDLRDDSAVTLIHDQGDFGTCWAFASLGSLESTLLVSGAATYDLSEDNMARQSGFSLDPYKGGGNDLMSTAYLARWAGPVLESDDVYGDYATPSGLSVVKHVQDVIFLPERTSATDNDAIKTAVMDDGAVAVSFYWTSSSYKSSTAAYYRASDPGSSNHAVDIIGWNDDYAASNFATKPSGDGAFLVRNSWGTSWGDDGYFWISYYDATLARGSAWCVGDSAVFTGEDADNYDSVYQYDPLGLVYSMYVDSSCPSVGWMANRFTASEAGILRAVSLYALGEDTAYKVYVGTSLSTSSADLVASGTLDDAGYHTVTLTANPSLSDGEAFYVMVRVETPDCDYPIATEGYCSGYSEAATSSTGQSYVASDDDGSPSSWEDIGGSTYAQKYNVCVKAFVDEAPSTTASGLSSSAAGGWTNHDSATVTLSASGGSGSLATYYKLAGDSGWTTFSAPFSVSGEGSHEVQYYSVDSNGLTETVNTGYVNIDTTAPTTTASGLDAGAGGDWRTSAATVTFTASDGDLSGVAATYYVIDGGSAQKYSGAFRMSTDGSHELTYYSVDAAGNVEAAQPGYLRIDATAPVTTASGLSSSVSCGWAAAAGIVNLSASDSTTGVVATYYATDDGGALAYSGAFTVSGDGSHKVQYYSVDAVGNTESAHTGFVNIDSVEPTSRARALALKRAKAKKGKRVAVRVALADTTPSCGSAKLVTTLATASGACLGRTTLAGVTVNKTRTVKVKLTRTLAKGTYYVLTRATDAAGNVQIKARKARLTVK